MSKFAKIPDEVLRRFVELTKTEIIVLSYLYGCQRKTTGQCNPSKGTIAKACGLARPHVTPAYTGLASKGWIVEHFDKDGRLNIELTIPMLSGRPTLPFSAPKRVKKTAKKETENRHQTITESVTPTVTDFVTPSITESVTFSPENEPFTLTESVTQGYEIGNLPYEIRNPTPYTILTDNEQTIEQRREELSIRENENEILKTQKTKNGTRISDPFLLTSEMRIYGAQKRPDVDLELETEKFVNYWRAKPGKDGRKLDWIATWRNWILSARSSNGTNRQPSEREKSAQRSANGYRMVEELERLGREKQQRAAERNLLSGDNAGDPQNPITR